jgi:hypothetical protein
MIVEWQRSHQIFLLRYVKNVGSVTVDGFKAYKYYIAIKLHFTKDSFDVFTNRGSVKGTREAFNARNDRYIFEKLARKFPVDRDIIQYYVSNFAYGNEGVVYDLAEAEENYAEWNKRKQSITKIFADDLSKILMDAYKRKIKESSIINFTLNQYPSILNLYLGKQIGIETLRIIDDFENLLGAWKQNSSMLLLWENEIRKVEKIRGFVKYDKDKVLTVFNQFKEEIKEL